MGTDDLFKKRRQNRKVRKSEFRTPKANSFLIVTEGECTEPYYFEGIKKEIEKKIGGSIDIVEAPMISIEGEGCSTMRLVEKAVEIISKSHIIYQNVWIVFDKDDFNDFNEAINAAHKYGLHTAWSNQCFEYWLYLHFNYSDAPLHRNDWFNKVNELFGQYALGNGKYEKNNPDIFMLLNNSVGVETAINHAKRRMSGFDVTKDKPSEYDPGTMVHLLVDSLMNYLK